MALSAFVSVSAQDTTAVQPIPSPWTTGLITQVGFSQVSLTNWAAGGFGSLALNSYINATADYAKDALMWNSQLQLGFGFLQTFGEGLKKTDDRIVLDSKFGYKAVDKLYFSAVFNFTSQFSTGYKGVVKESDKVSNFFAPAYTSLGLGIDYTPNQYISLNFAPLTGKVTMVKDAELRTKYGNAENEFARWELGAQLKVNAKVQVKDFSAETMLTLFSNYLDKPQNIKVNWDVAITAKLTRFLSASLRTNLIYDDKVRFLEKKDKSGNVIVDESGKPILYPAVQFKELFSLNFQYTLTNKK